MLADLKSRGLAVAPELAIGDGALGFWKALEQEFGVTRHQRCWVHKAMNVLNKLPKSVQPRAKADLKEIWMAEGRDDAEKAFDRFLAKYQAKYDKAADCLAKDRDAMLAFYDFPAEHVWTPPPEQDESQGRFCAGSGAVMCPASDAAESHAAGPYGSSRARSTSLERA